MPTLKLVTNQPPKPPPKPEELVKSPATSHSTRTQLIVMGVLTIAAACVGYVTGSLLMFLVGVLILFFSYRTFHHSEWFKLRGVAVALLVIFFVTQTAWRFVIDALTPSAPPPQQTAVQPVTAGQVAQAMQPGAAQCKNTEAETVTDPYQYIVPPHSCSPVFIRPKGSNSLTWHSYGTMVAYIVSTNGVSSTLIDSPMVNIQEAAERVQFENQSEEPIPIDMSPEPFRKPPPRVTMNCSNTNTEEVASQLRVTIQPHTCTPIYVRPAGWRSLTWKTNQGWLACYVVRPDGGRDTYRIKDRPNLVQLAERAQFENQSDEPAVIEISAKK